MRTFVALTALILATSLVVGCSQETTIYRDTAETINVKAGREFILATPTNPASVFMWRESYDSSRLELVQATYDINEAARDAGAQLYLEQHFRFKALKKGSTEITIALVRRTLDGTTVAKEKIFRVKIE